MPERFKLPMAVFLLICKDNKLLLLRRKNTGWHDGDFDLPAGHIDGGELLVETVGREALEELGIVIQPSDTEFAHLYHGLHADGKEYCKVFFKIKKWKNEPQIMEPDKCDMLDWFSMDNLPANFIPSSRAVIEKIVINQSFSESGFDSPVD